MNTLDVILLIVLGYGFIKGIFNGFFVELASFLSFIIGVFIAVKFSYFVGDMLKENFSEDSNVIEISSFAITFILVVVGVHFLAKVFTKLANFSHLGLLNKLMGGIFGLLKILVFISVYLQFSGRIFTSSTIVKDDLKDESLFYYPVIRISDILYPNISEWFNSGIKNLDD